MIKVKVIEKAIQLMEYTFVSTSNRKRYPIKYIQLIKRIQNTSMNIYESLMEANRLDLNSYQSERIRFESKAITDCDKLSCYAELSMRLGRIGSDSLEHWQKRIGEVKAMTITWRKTEESRK